MRHGSHCTSRLWRRSSLDDRRFPIPGQQAPTRKCANQQHSGNYDDSPFFSLPSHDPYHS